MPAQIHHSCRIELVVALFIDIICCISLFAIKNFLMTTPLDVLDLPFVSMSILLHLQKMMLVNSANAYDGFIDAVPFLALESPSLIGLVAFGKFKFMKALQHQTTALMAWRFCF
jgi:hypothetical protein